MSLLSCQRPCWFLPSSSKRHGPSHQLKEVLILSLHHQEERWPYAFSAWGWQPGVCFWVHQIQHGQHVRRGSSPPVFSIDAASAWILHDPDDLWMSLPNNYSVILFLFHSIPFPFCSVSFHSISFSSQHGQCYRQRKMSKRPEGCSFSVLHLDFVFLGMKPQWEAV